MKHALTAIFDFFRNDFFPNLGYYLLQVFLVVLIVIVFGGINIVVRFFTDPLCVKVLRMREDRRGPSLVGLFFSTIILVLLLVTAYVHFPQMRPTVIGWAGEKLQRIIVWDRLPDLKTPEGYQPVPKGEPGQGATPGAAEKSALPESGGKKQAAGATPVPVPAAPAASQ